ncbi:acetyltransferase [Pseudenhygromyxa sp. WMMC2535]|uniref:acetyltransferase n=1 Tax=Pseudenhygromyxa sp. WMMC2535 TaxID=2712867 RepID=UPI00159503D3|nr:acetyltransferase [Pseudenhygromyxa sp. WMMC2535]NVB40619.1 acetyltransferase [Pseudenhygromyxa sp. WMMC2535]
MAMTKPALPPILGAYLVAAAALCSTSACIEALEVDEDLPQAELALEETRRVELRYLRFDVEGFEQRLGLEELRALPQTTLDGVWLLDLELTPLVHNALTQLRELPSDEAAELSVAAQNMRRLLAMTPDNADLSGTSIEELIGLSQAVGLPPARALADIFEIGINDTFIPIAANTQAVVEGLIASHPATQLRDGPIDDEHPDGKWAVAPNSLPITLGDVVNNFDGLAERFGPVETEFGTHPGFISEAEGFSVVEEAFEMVVKVNLNALPYKGVDMTDASHTSVNSVASQIADVFPVDDPDWMQVDGLVEDPSISLMTVVMVENDAYIAAGDDQEPAPLGNSPVWDLPPWEFERVVAEMTVLAAAEISDHCVEYDLGTGVQAFSACIDADHWIVFETFNNVGSPPPPAYAWDTILELAQVRQHDGGLGEGEADIAFSLTDVPLGVSSADIVEEIRSNLAADPVALEDLAENLLDNSDGFSDFYYWKPAPGAAEAIVGDWLFFVTEDDIPVDDSGPERPYAYANPGFFADAGLSQKLSSTELIDGDDSHEKIRVAPGDTLYVEDDVGRVYCIEVLEKPSPNRLDLDLTRVK